MELSRASDDVVQSAYARWLRLGSRVGVTVLVGSFAAYVAGMVGHIPIERLPELWELPAATYLDRVGMRAGWHWATFVHRSDMLVLAGIALLASSSVASLVAAVGAFRRNGERTFALICVLQVLVLLVAASGLLAMGH